MRNRTASLPNHQLLSYHFTLWIRCHGIHTFTMLVRHVNKRKEKLRMGFWLPKKVMLLLVPKEADFQITAYTTYSEREEGKWFRRPSEKDSISNTRHLSQREKTHPNRKKKTQQKTSHGSVRILSPNNKWNGLSYALSWISTFPSPI